MSGALRIGMAALTMQMLFAGCATTNQEGGVYHESSFNDLNRPPAQLSPPNDFSKSETEQVDPVTQRGLADFHYAKAEALSFEGKSKEAIAEFKEVLIYDNQSPKLYFRLAAEYLKSGQVKESVGAVQQALTKDAKYSDARILLGSIYSAMKLYDKAIEQYETVLKYEPKNLEAPLYLGAVYSEQKHYEKAFKYFQSLLKNSDYSTPHLAYYYMGRVQIEMGGKQGAEAAEKYLRKAIALKPDFVDAVMSLGALIAKKKSPQAAVNFYIEHQKKHGGYLKIAEILSQYYIEKGDYNNAYEQLEIIESQSEEPLNAKLKLALILVERKQFEKAIDKLQEILKEVPESDKVNFYLGAIYEETKDPQSAIKYYRNVIPSSSFYGDAVLHSAMLYKQLDKTNEAMSLLAEATKNRVQNASIFIYYSSLLDEAEQTPKAVEVMKLAVQIFPDHAQTHFYMGTLLDKGDDKKNVIAHMQKAIELEDDHVQALNYLAFTLAELNQNLDQAEWLAKRAVNLSPEDGYVIDTLGWVFFKRGKYTESLVQLEKAYQLQPKVSIIAEHLAEVYLKNQLVGKAREMFNKAAELESDKARSQALRTRLTAIEQADRGTNDRRPAAMQPNDR